MHGFSKYAADLIAWYEEHGRPLFVSYAPDRLELLDAESARLKRLGVAADREIQVCFLGNSGVGKSTLINSLVAREKVVLPQGGVGPLTAQAVTVRASLEPYFRASYLSRGRVNRTLFALERHHEGELKKLGKDPIAPLDDTQLIFDGDELGERAAVVAEADELENAGAGQLIEDLKKRARLMLLGSQWGEIDLPLLLDGLRLCLGAKPRWDAMMTPEMVERIDRIRSCLELAKDPDGTYECQAATDGKAFKRDLDAHAGGFLAPLLRKLEVGWDTPLLMEGAVLVDLPGLGTSGDDYQTVTKEVMREARMVVLVVDRSGVSESSAHLLHSTGFLNALLHDSHDPAAEPATLVVVMVKIDDSATEDRLADKEQNGEDARPWTEHFERRCGQAEQLIRDQTRHELQRLVDDGPEATRQERQAAVSQILGNLRVHPVSAPQFRRFYIQDSEQPTFIRDAEQSRIPALSDDLRALLVRHRARTRDHLRTAARDFRARLENTISLTRARWEDDQQTDEELEKLRTDLETFLAPLRRELDPRRGAFREFLQSTIPGQITLRVDVVAGEARQDITNYLRRFEDYHWATLRASVSHGGYFNGARLIDLPNELTLRFEEPIAVVWSKHILQELRRKTKELSESYISMLDQVIEWAATQGARFQPKLLEGVREQLRGDAKILATVGRDAINELKAVVRKELYALIEVRIRARCKRFVDEKRHVGPGTKRKILEFFRGELAESVVEGAKPAALKVLIDNFDAIAAEIRETFQQYGSPLDHASSELLDKHEARIRRADKQRRRKALSDFAAAGDMLPPAPPEIASGEQAA